MPGAEVAATDSAAATAPSAAPAKPPNENAACSDDRIGRRMRRSIATPWAFIARSIVELHSPTANSPRASAGTLRASPGSRTATINAATENRQKVRLERPGSSRPTIGIAMIAATAGASSARPRAPVVAPTRSDSAGIRDAHEANSAPLMKNTTVTPARGLMRAAPRCREPDTAPGRRRPRRRPSPVG